MNRILCVGDGFAHGHIWPEWPQILEALVPSYQVRIVSGIGAGNEYLINGLLDLEPDRDTVIFQWASHERFDKIIQDSNWDDLARNDPVYSENFYARGNNKWWLSSTSGLSEIQKYHGFYVQSQQSQQRLYDQHRLIQGYLIGKACHYIAISTSDQHTFSQEIRFKSLRQSEVQPSPPVHMIYLEEKIIPFLPLTIDDSRRERLKSAILETKWKPYDPDRAEIWSNIVSNLDSY